MTDRPALRLIGPPLIWFLHFGASYGSLSVLCNAGVPGTHIYLVLGATLIAMAALAALAVKRPEGTLRLLNLGGLALIFLCLVAVAWTALAAFALPAC